MARVTGGRQVGRRFVVRGMVQGVGFRWFVRDTAKRLGLSGWVANQVDGSVSGEARGQEAAIGGFLTELASGPRLARVESLEVSEFEPAGEHEPEFEIRS